jgi:hypothetical protein
MAAAMAKRGGPGKNLALVVFFVLVFLVVLVVLVVLIVLVVLVVLVVHLLLLLPAMSAVLQILQLMLGSEVTGEHLRRFLFGPTVPRTVTLQRCTPRKARRGVQKSSNELPAISRSPDLPHLALSLAISKMDAST